MKELMQSLLQLQTLEFGEKKDATITATIAVLRGKIAPQILGHYDRGAKRVWQQCRIRFAPAAT